MFPLSPLYTLSPIPLLYTLYTLYTLSPLHTLYHTRFNVEIESKDMYGCTALHVACKVGNYKIADMLVMLDAGTVECV